MRIEGAYTFAAPIQRVFAALSDPEALAAALPGCERVRQLGPAGADGAAAFELYLHQDDGRATSVSVRTTTARRPTYLRAELRGYNPLGAFTGRGQIDLVAQEEHTIGAYVWDMDVPHLAPERVAGVTAVAHRFACAFSERLGEHLRATAPVEPPAGIVDGQPAVRVVRVNTARGQIVALRAVLPGLPSGARVWMQRATWIGAGFVLGIAAIAVAVGLLRRLIGEED